ncbi:MAG: hypothetical protein U9R08_02875 [Nanoarchaeota archaeon]|nr:hypothetical protein [Nanoarchaeota archaeon]
MTGTQFLALVREKTSQNSTTFTDAEILTMANIFKDEIAADIAQKNPSAFIISDTADLSDDVREYEIKGGTMNQLVRIEVSFNGTDWYVIKPIQIKDLSVQLVESEITADYSNDDDARYFQKGNRIYILSGTITDQTDCLKFVFQAFPTDWSSLGGADLSAWSDAKNPGLPKTFHELLARRVSIEYKDNKEKKLSPLEMRYEKDLLKAINNFITSSQAQSIIASTPSMASHGDYGYDY